MESNKEITGSGSFAFVYPTLVLPPLPNETDYTLNVHNAGNHMLMGVVVTVYDVVTADSSTMNLRQREDVGFIAPRSGRTMNLALRNVPPGLHLRLFVSSQTHDVQEDIYFRDSGRRSPAERLDYKLVARRQVWSAGQGQPTHQNSGYPATA